MEKTTKQLEDHKQVASLEIEQLEERVAPVTYHGFQGQIGRG